jgi:hypothetical protein
MRTTELTVPRWAAWRNHSVVSLVTSNPSVMTLSIFEHGDGHFRLFRDGCEVGWVDGRDVGFLGFDTEADAADAAIAAYEALSVWLARQSRAQRTPQRRLDLRVENGKTSLTLGDIAVGRLVSEAEDRTTTSGSYGFELRLPPRIGAALSAAHVIDQALTRHRELRGLDAVNVPGISEEVFLKPYSIANRD